MIDLICYSRGYMQTNIHALLTFPQLNLSRIHKPSNLQYKIFEDLDAARIRPDLHNVLLEISRPNNSSNFIILNLIAALI